MFKKYFLKSTLFIFVFIFSFNFFSKDVFASPYITSFLLNGKTQDVVFNPNTDETVSIEVKANTSVKFTRLYICRADQVCNGTSGNYTRYFTSSEISESLLKTWNGKGVGDKDFVQAGEYKIMVSMIENGGDPITEFGKNKIFVNYSSSTELSINDNPSVDEDEVIQEVFNGGSLSSHSATEDLSNYSQKSEFEIYSGRERMALVGSNLEFKAKYSGDCTPSFKWSFGDGLEYSGEKVFHIYKNPGEYNVVLNGLCGEKQAISRTKVKIFDPQVEISFIETKGLEIKNNGDFEINIGGWSIKNYQKEVFIPKDTIISPRQSIIISEERLKFDNLFQKVSLIDESGSEVSTTFIFEPEIKKEIEVANVPQGGESMISTENYSSSSHLGNTVLMDTFLDADEAMGEKEFHVASAYQPENPTVFSKIIDFPIKAIKTFLSLFYDF